MLTPATKSLISAMTAMCSSVVTGQMIRTNVPVPATLFQKLVLGIGTYGIGNAVSLTVRDTMWTHITELEDIFVGVKQEQAKRTQ